jgi:Ca2+-binding EF-hand superfamily protein
VQTITVDSTAVMVYRSIFAEYAKWFRELDKENTGSVDRKSVQAYLGQHWHSRSSSESDKFDMLEKLDQR